MTVAERESIRCDQMLHGYAGGHRLIAASRKVSQNSERRVRFMSDLSGSSIRNGFEEYLSGYPLQEDRLYAFARTWYAKEMRRPGCVWTHTLLVSLDDLARIGDIGQLLPEFQRPDGEHHDKYEKPLKCHFATDRHPRRLEANPGFVEALVQAMYLTDDAVILGSDSSHKYENLILNLWNQLWPGLRSTVSFCSGSLELRASDLNIDVQVIPNRDSRLLRRAEEEGVVITDDAFAAHPSEEWVELAARDIIDPNNALHFGSFLHHYGAASHRNRRDYRKYARSFWVLNQQGRDESFAHIATEIADAFPGRDEATSLKRGVFGKPCDRQFFRNVSDVAVLAELCRLKDAGAYDSVALQVAQRFHEAWAESRSKALGLLKEVTKPSSNDLASCVANEAAAIVEGRDIKKLVRHDCDIVVELTRRNVGLATLPEVWKCPDISIEQIANNFVDAFQSGSVAPPAVVAALITAKRDELCSDMESILGSSLAYAVLDAGADAIKLADQRYPNKWTDVLERHSEAVIRWLIDRVDPPDETDVFASLGLTPSNKRACREILSVWRRIIADAPGISPSTVLHSRVVVMVAAMDDGDDNSEKAFRAAFPLVYHFASEDRMYDRTWQFLKLRMPDVGFSWDKCKKLRAGLVEQCVQHNWSLETFVECSRGDILGQILGMWGWSRLEKKFLLSASGDIAAGETTATEQQRDAATSYMGSRW